MKDSKYEEALERAKQGLPIDKIFPELNESEDERLRKEIRTFLIDMECKKDWIAYLEKQKSAEWSEEDEFFRQQLIVYCDNCVQDSLAAKCVDWLKSLRPQPKQEWSEEDNINLNACIQIINDAWKKAQIKELGTTKFAPHYYGDLIDWLKSLQPHWKPSKEQMEAVEEALEFYSGTTDTAKGLRSLYNDLKKLQL